MGPFCCGFILIIRFKIVTMLSTLGSPNQQDMVLSQDWVGGSQVPNQYWHKPPTITFPPLPLPPPHPLSQNNSMTLTRVKRCFLLDIVCMRRKNTKWDGKKRVPQESPGMLIIFLLYQTDHKIFNWLRWHTTLSQLWLDMGTSTMQDAACCDTIVPLPL